MQISWLMTSYTQPDFVQIWWRVISANLYQKCLTLCSKILLNVLRKSRSKNLIIDLLSHNRWRIYQTRSWCYTCEKNRNDIKYINDGAIIICTQDIRGNACPTLCERTWNKIIVPLMGSGSTFLAGKTSCLERIYQDTRNVWFFTLLTLVHSNITRFSFQLLTR